MPRSVIHRIGRPCLASMLAECGGVPDGAELSHRIVQIPGPILTRPPRSESDPDFGDVEALVPAADFPGECVLELGVERGWTRAHGWRAGWGVRARLLGFRREVSLRYEWATDATGPEPRPGDAVRWVWLRVAPALRALLAQARPMTALYLTLAPGEGGVELAGPRDAGARVPLPDALEIPAPADLRALVARPGHRAEATPTEEAR